MFAFRVATVGALISLSGCMSAVKPAIQKPLRLSSYTIGKKSEATVGSAVFEVKKAYEVQAYEFLEDVKAPLIPEVRDYVFKKGKILPTVLIDEKGRASVSDSDWPANIVLQIGPDGVIDSQKGDGWRVYTVNQIDPISGGRLLEGIPTTQKHFGQSGGWPKTPVAKISTNPFLVVNKGYKAELLYLGKTGNSTRFSFREYSNDFARPAFSQELTYNLKESSVVTFKTLKIQIHQATNSLVQFTVLEDGGLPWVP